MVWKQCLNGDAKIATFTRCSFIMLCLACTVSSFNAYARIDKEDQEMIDAATCSDLMEERAEFVTAEQDLSDALESDAKSTIATNVIGVATFATLGLGFFSWSDNADAKGMLVEMRELRAAIDAAILKKGCRN